MVAKGREKMLVIVALIAVGALAGDRLVVTPMVNLWKRQAADMTHYRQSLDKGTLLLERRAAIEERWQDMGARSLPANSAEAEKNLLDAVGEWASSSRLAVNSIRPRWIIDETLDNRLELRVSASGDIAAVTRFLYGVESAALPVRLEEVEIRARDDQGRELTLDARFTGLVLRGGRT